jgi:pSer/pThr/pTyr-binding forkhead associated (FHA) protein
VNGAKHELVPPGVLIGRGSEADLQVVDPGVSRRHAEIRVAFIGRRYTVTLHDLGSTNGTLVDGTRASFSTLAEGSAVTVGNTVLTIHIPSPARS